MEYTFILEAKAVKHPYKDQWLKNYFCVHFFYSILGILFSFLSKIFFNILFALFLSFNILKIRPGVLWKICHGSTRSPSWLCEKSVIALREIRQLWRLASKNWRQSPEVTNSSQSHDGFLTEPWRIPPRAMTDSW